LRGDRRSTVEYLEKCQRETNEAWLDFVEQTKCEDNPTARAFFLAGFQAGVQFVEGVRISRDFAIEEIHRTVRALGEQSHEA
jgi:hypothetical protein